MFVSQKLAITIQLFGMQHGMQKSFKIILVIGGFLEFDYFSKTSWGQGERFSYRCMKTNEDGSVNYSDWIILDDWKNPAQDSGSQFGNRTVHHRLDLDLLEGYDSFEFRINVFVTRVGHTSADMHVFLRNFSVIEI